MVSSVIFKSMTYFELSFIYSTRFKLRLIFFADGYLIAAQSFVGKAILPLLNCFCSFVKNQLFSISIFNFLLMKLFLLINVSIIKGVYFYDLI